MPSPKKSSPDESPDSLKFEEAMGELEALVSEMEEAELPLDELIGKYERGMKLAKVCEAKLSEAEKKVEVLTSGKKTASSRQAPADEEEAKEEEEGVSLF